MRKNGTHYLLKVFILLMFVSLEALPQQSSATHTRGKLWETLYNYGFIGDPGAWDYSEVTGIGFYPGFSGFQYPNNEEQANGFITDANFHNFRSGPWIIAKNAKTLVPPGFTEEQRDYLIYHSSLASSTGNDLGTLVGSLPPFARVENYSGTEGFNPLIPEEVNYTVFPTVTGITVKQRSMTWSYPGYRDFIIYDYTFVNTGDVALQSVNQVRQLTQTLDSVWIVFHSGIQVSTKGVLNFHYSDDFLSSTAPAGGFGWHPGSGYTDYYSVENDGTDGKGLLYYSRDYNGGREPVPWDQYDKKPNWQQQLTVAPYTHPELQDPSAFGFTFLYRTPPMGSTNVDPFEADPTYFNIYSDEAEKFHGKTVDFEGFGLKSFSPSEIYDYATHNHRVPNTGKQYNWYTSSFGPYHLAPGDSIRIIVAEVAGTLDLHEVVSGDTLHMLKNFTEDWYNDSVSVAIRKNVEAVRNAIKWGMGAPAVNGVQYPADVPDAPPAPTCSAVNASKGSEQAVIAIKWDKLAEDARINDASGNIFFDGSADLSGYRIYRGTDKRGIWDLVADIPRAQFGNYWNTEDGAYEYNDTTVKFGLSYMYYVQAYNSTPRTWTSANFTVVNNLPELASGDYNRTPFTSAKAGPVSVAGGWDVFVVPNPYVDGDPQRSFSGQDEYKIEFRNLPEKATIHIYSVAGDLIKSINHTPDAAGNKSGSAEWDQRSDAGLLVAPGLYIYVVQSETEGTSGSKTTGKLMIIR